MAEEYVDALGKGLLNSWERKLSHLSEGHRQCPAVCRISAYAWLAASYLRTRCFVLPSAFSSSSSLLFFRFWAMESGWIKRSVLEEKGWEVQLSICVYFSFIGEFIHLSFHRCARLGLFFWMMQSVSNFSSTNWNLDSGLRFFCLVGCILFLWFGVFFLIIIICFRVWQSTQGTDHCVCSFLSHFQLVNLL